MYPFNPNEVICRLPEVKANIDKTEYVSESVLEMLKELRPDDQTRKKQRRTKISVEPGKSVEFEDLEKLAEQERLSAELKKKKQKAGTKRKCKADKKKNCQIDCSESDSSDEVQDRSNEKKTAKKKLNKEKPKSSKKLVRKEKKKERKFEDNCDIDMKEKTRGRKRKAEDGNDSCVKRMIKNCAASDSNSGNGSNEEETESEMEEDFENAIVNQTVRPSIHEIQLGDYVVVEYLIPQNKKHFIGLVKDVLKDVLNVTFLTKKRLKFMYPASDNLSIILPTQVVKVLSTPLEKTRGELVFQKKELQGFYFN